MLKIVLDTNVYISALARGGLPFDIFLAATRGELNLFISDSILEELERVLRQKFKWAPERLRQILAIVHLYAQLVLPEEKLTVIEEDDSDNRILEFCTLGGGGESIEALPRTGRFTGFERLVVGA